jgi:hypothetical protein
MTPLIAQALYDTFHTARLSEHPEDAPEYERHAVNFVRWLRVHGLVIREATQPTADAKVELAPCPFCGGPAELEETDAGGWSVGCEEKALSVHYCMGYQSLTSFATKREAVAAWNMRRPPYRGEPCSTCGAVHPFDNVFCSDAFHTPPSASALEASHSLTEAIDQLREGLRGLMLGQPMTKGRATYTDGFASGLAEAIRRIDAMQAARPIAPETRCDQCGRPGGGHHPACILVACGTPIAPVQDDDATTLAEGCGVAASRSR